MSAVSSVLKPCTVCVVLPDRMSCDIVIQGILKHPIYTNPEHYEEVLNAAFLTANITADRYIFMLEKGKDNKTLELVIPCIPSICNEFTSRTKRLLLCAACKMYSERNLAHANKNYRSQIKLVNDFMLANQKGVSLDFESQRNLDTIFASNISVTEFLGALISSPKIRHLWVRVKSKSGTPYRLRLSDTELAICSEDGSDVAQYSWAWQDIEIPKFMKREVRIPWLMTQKPPELTAVLEDILHSKSPISLSRKSEVRKRRITSQVVYSSGDPTAIPLPDAKLQHQIVVFADEDDTSSKLVYQIACARAMGLQNNTYPATEEVETALELNSGDDCGSKRGSKQSASSKKKNWFCGSLNCMSKQKNGKKKPSQPIVEPPLPGQMRVLSTDAQSPASAFDVPEYELEPPKRLRAPEQPLAAALNKSMRVSLSPKTSRVSEEAGSMEEIRGDEPVNKSDDEAITNLHSTSIGGFDANHPISSLAAPPLESEPAANGFVINQSSQDTIGDPELTAVSIGYPASLEYAMLLPQTTGTVSSFGHRSDACNPVQPRPVPALSEMASTLLQVGEFGSATSTSHHREPDGGYRTDYRIVSSFDRQPEAMYIGSPSQPLGISSSLVQVNGDTSLMGKPPASPNQKQTFEGNTCSAKVPPGLIIPNGEEMCSHQKQLTAATPPSPRSPGKTFSGIPLPRNPTRVMAPPHITAAIIDQSCESIADDRQRTSTLSTSSSSLPKVFASGVYAQEELLLSIPVQNEQSPLLKESHSNSQPVSCTDASQPPPGSPPLPIDTPKSPPRRLGLIAPKVVVNKPGINVYQGGRQSRATSLQPSSSDSSSVPSSHMQPQSSNMVPDSPTFLLNGTKSIPSRPTISGIKPPSTHLESNSENRQKSRSSSLSSPQSSRFEQHRRQQHQDEPASPLIASSPTNNSSRESKTENYPIHTGIRLPSRLPRQTVAK